MKKITTILLAIAMMSAMSVNGMAAENRAIDPRAEPCSNCTNGKIFVRTEYGKWSLPTVVPECQHGFPKGGDKIYTRSVYTTADCNTCDYHQRFFEYEDERTDCFGRSFFILQPEN